MREAAIQKATAEQIVAEGPDQDDPCNNSAEGEEEDVLEEDAALPDDGN